jgi:hypothetical protein
LTSDQEMKLLISKSRFLTDHLLRAHAFDKVSLPDKAEAERRQARDVASHIYSKLTTAYLGATVDSAEDGKA